MDDTVAKDIGSQTDNAVNTFKPNYAFRLDEMLQGQREAGTSDSLQGDVVLPQTRLGQTGERSQSSVSKVTMPFAEPGSSYIMEITADGRTETYVVASPTIIDTQNKDQPEKKPIPIVVRVTEQLAALKDRMDTLTTSGGDPTKVDIAVLTPTLVIGRESGDMTAHAASLGPISRLRMAQTILPDRSGDPIPVIKCDIPTGITVNVNAVEENTGWEFGETKVPVEGKAAEAGLVNRLALAMGGMQLTDFNDRQQPASEPTMKELIDTGYVVRTGILGEARLQGNKLVTAQI
jgi:hypothetical protein